MRRIFAAFFLLTLSATSSATADGPDYWRVSGIADGDELNMRRGPSVKFQVARKLPHNARQLLNLGCYPDFDQNEWQRLSKDEQKLATSMRWCRVMHQGLTGWIYSRYLKED